MVNSESSLNDTRPFFQFITQRFFGARPSQQTPTPSLINRDSSADPQEHQLLADGRQPLGLQLQLSRGRRLQGPALIFSTSYPTFYKCQSPVRHPDRFVNAGIITVAVTGRSPASLYPAQAPDEKGGDEVSAASQITRQQKNSRQNEKVSCRQNDKVSCRQSEKVSCRQNDKVSCRQNDEVSC